MNPTLRVIVELLVKESFDTSAFEAFIKRTSSRDDLEKIVNVLNSKKLKLSHSALDKIANLVEEFIDPGVAIIVAKTADGIDVARMQKVVEQHGSLKNYIEFLSIPGVDIRSFSDNLKDCRFMGVDPSFHMLAKFVIAAHEPTILESGLSCFFRDIEFSRSYEFLRILNIQQKADKVGIDISKLVGPLVDNFFDQYDYACRSLLVASLDSWLSVSSTVLGTVLLGIVAKEKKSKDPERLGDYHVKLTFDSNVTRTDEKKFENELKIHLEGMFDVFVKSYSSEIQAFFLQKDREIDWRPAETVPEDYYAL